MHINLPDPDPGRCKTYRVENGQSYRCVEYDNEKHECDFRILRHDHIHTAQTEAVGAAREEAIMNGPLFFGVRDAIRSVPILHGYTITPPTGSGPRPGPTMLNGGEADEMAEKALAVVSPELAKACAWDRLHTMIDGSEGGFINDNDRDVALQMMRVALEQES